MVIKPVTVGIMVFVKPIYIVIAVFPLLALHFNHPTAHEHTN